MLQIKMYTYKFTITYFSGKVRSEWVCSNDGESLSSLKSRADNFMDKLEAEGKVYSVRMVRRTIPGI